MFQRKRTDGPLLPSEAALIAVFGALWGFMEITLGATLKGMRLPFAGAILASLAAIIALTGYYFVPRRSSILMMGGVAALCKIFSIGTVIAGPFFAILLEAIVAQTAVVILGIHRPGYFLSGAAMVCYTVLHPFITQGLIFGGRIYKVYWATAEQIAQSLHLQTVHFTVMIAVYLSLHALAGGLAGLFAFRLARSTQQELAQWEHSA